VRIIGLTGNIGSGKSLAARLFEEEGIPVIDADEVGHAVMEPGQPAFDDLVAAFGTLVLSGGRIDREVVSRMVFANPDLRRKLNEITHPAIFAEIQGRCARLAAQGHQTAVIEATLIAEGDRREPWLSELIVVLCNAEERFRRLVEVRGMNADDARRRMEAQQSAESKVALADWVIRNEGTVEELRREVRRVAEDIHGQAS
jgi:dephospho-CoA kinase